jgi:hypothetical protein
MNLKHALFSALLCISSIAYTNNALIGATEQEKKAYQAIEKIFDSEYHPLVFGFAFDFASAGYIAYNPDSSVDPLRKKYAQEFMQKQEPHASPLQAKLMDYMQTYATDNYLMWDSLLELIKKKIAANGHT